MPPSVRPSASRSHHIDRSANGWVVGQIIRSFNPIRGWPRINSKAFARFSEFSRVFFISIVPSQSRPNKHGTHRNANAQKRALTNRKGLLNLERRPTHSRSPFGLCYQVFALRQPPFGPALRTDSGTNFSNFEKLSRNMPASFLACSSYAALSDHVVRGLRMSSGTSVTCFGT